MIVCLVGQPLSGKTTLARRLSEVLGYEYFSTGDYFRELKAEGKEEGIKQSDLSYLANNQINRAVVERCEEADELVLDGFPRSVEQAKMLANKDFVVVFVCVNPIIMYARMECRRRDELDCREVVVARTNAAMNLHRDLIKVVGDKMITVVNDGDLEKTMQEVLCKLGKRLEG